MGRWLRLSRPEPLIELKQEDSFLQDERDVKAALIHVRRFAKPEPIRSWDEAGEIADAIKDLRLVIDSVEEHRKATNAPYEATTKTVNAHYKEMLAQPKAAVNRLKGKAGDFKREQDRLERERQRKEQERLGREAEQRAEEAQAAAERAAEQSSEEAKREAAEAHARAAQAATATAAPANPPKQVRGSFGAIGSRIDYEHTVADSSALPREYLTVNDKAIKAAIKGERAMAKAQERPFNLDLIPGVTITPVERDVSR
jgi:septal ring factor EnvC (AmiA/AmiB activator)